ncbi:hypothetical protein ACF063_05845 [Streptomyces chartreusis]|uniref:hypothetical protein n=1 Tax=Streptomyces chartreusis TaxID=1969 RepID=UPI003700BE48
MSVPRRQRDGPRTVEAELDTLVEWLNAKRGRMSYAQLAAVAGAAGFRVTADTLRRAVDGRVPTFKVVRAWAAGTGAGPAEGERLLERVRAARLPDARKAYDAGRIATRAGLVRAMERIRARAGQPSLARMSASPEAALRLPVSTLSAVLRGERAATADLLTAFLAVCRVPEAEAQALLAARNRVEGRQRTTVYDAYPCAVAERAEERREYERERARYRGLSWADEADDEGGWYGPPSKGSLSSEEELEEMEAQTLQADDDRLRRMLRAYVRPE